MRIKVVLHVTPGLVALEQHAHNFTSYYNDYKVTKGPTQAGHNKCTG
jgi:hypothetical protein